MVAMRVVHMAIMQVIVVITVLYGRVAAIVTVGVVRVLVRGMV